MHGFYNKSKQIRNIRIFRIWSIDLHKISNTSCDIRVQMELFNDCDKSPFSLVMTPHSTLISPMCNMGKKILETLKY